MSETTETTTTTETAAPVVDPNEINYEGVNLARSGVEATEDGQAPGETTEQATTETVTTEKPQTEDEKAAAASEAARTLAGRKNSLADDVRTLRADKKELERQLDDERRAIESWRPILERLDGRPDLQQAVLNGTMTVAKAEATKASDDQTELKDIAEDLGYYHLKADGTPDYDRPNLERAEKYRARHQRWANQAAESKVQPIAQTEQQRQIADRIEFAVKAARERGDADPEILREMFTQHASKNPKWVLDNESANTLYDKVVARSWREGKLGAVKPKTITTETTERDTRVLHTEAPGGKATGPKLTQAERELGAAYGLTDKDWERAEAHSQVRRGYSRLTDD